MSRMVGFRKLIFVLVKPTSIDDIDDTVSVVTTIKPRIKPSSKFMKVSSKLSGSSNSSTMLKLDTLKSPNISRFAKKSTSKFMHYADYAKRNKT